MLSLEVNWLLLEMAAGTLAPWLMWSLEARKTLDSE